MNTILKNQIVLHIIVVIWGFTGILGKSITISSLDIAWYRMAIATLIIFPFVLFYRKFKIFPDYKTLLLLVATGCIVLMHWFFFFEAIKISTVSVGIICMGTSTFFTALIEPLFFKRKILIQEIILGIVASLGMVVIFGVVPIQYKWGIFFGLLASLFASTFTVINGYLVQKGNKPSVITLWEMFAGCVIATCIFLFNGKLDADFFTLSYQDWMGILFIGVICTAVAFIVSVQVMKHLSPFTVSISVNLEPVYTIFLALLIFGEEEIQGPGFYIGSCIILLAVFTNAYLKKRKRRKEKLKAIENTLH